MSILFDSTKPVKYSQGFGQGIEPARKPHFVPSDADRAWAAYHLNADATDYDVIEPTRDWDQEAGESEATDRMCAGLPLF